jgi:phosphopantothenoylcysteine decarboxylase/phosphopantothenate--cysteine ligase
VLAGFAAKQNQRRGAPEAAGQARRPHRGQDVSKSGAGFDADTNEATLVGHDGQDALPLMPKTRLAGLILDRVEALLVARGVPTRA